MKFLLCFRFFEKLFAAIGKFSKKFGCFVSFAAELM
jgi:hypothetical protein